MDKDKDMDKDNNKYIYTQKLKKSTNRRELMCHSTEAEKSAAKILNNMNIKYIKQYPIYTGRKVYYADLYLPEYRLVLEIDGGYHFTAHQKRKDENRSAGIRRLGYHVYRITNSEARSVEVIRSKIRRITKAIQNSDRLYQNNNKMP